MAVLARAGVPIRGSLERLKERMAEKEVTLLSQKVNEGERLGEAFVAAGFSPFECHLVVAGEKSAQLDTVFEHLSEYWKRQLEMHQALIRPLYYPIVVFHLVLVVGAIIDVTTASLVVALNHFFIRLTLFYFLGVLLYLIVRISWASEVARPFWLRVPIIGSALRAAYAYRWITALRIEFSAGVSLPNAVADAWRASGHLGCERLAEEGERAMWEGTALSVLIQRWKQLPRDWIDFIETGELSGALDAAFKNLEAEAARAWSLAEQRMTEWLPKILYFVVLLIVAVQVGMLMYKVIVAPMSEVQNQIDNAINGK